MMTVSVLKIFIKSKQLYLLLLLTSVPLLQIIKNTANSTSFTIARKVLKKTNDFLVCCYNE